MPYQILLVSGLSLILTSFISALFCSYVAVKKGYNSTIWFVWGVFFNIFALISIAGLPTLKYKLFRKRYQELENYYNEAKNRLQKSKEQYSKEGILARKKAIENMELDLEKFEKELEAKEFKII